MPTFTLRPGVVLADAAFNYEPTGGRYDLKDALTAGGGSITLTNEGLVTVLRSLMIDPFGTELLLDDQTIFDDTFGYRFADRINRRRR